MADKKLKDASLAEIVNEMLLRLGEDPQRDGLLKTPERVEKSLRWLTRGYELSVAAAVGNTSQAMMPSGPASTPCASMAARKFVATLPSVSTIFACSPSAPYTRAGPAMLIGPNPRVAASRSTSSATSGRPATWIATPL